MKKLLLFTALATALGGCYIVQPQAGENIVIQQPQR